MRRKPTSGCKKGGLSSVKQLLQTDVTRNKPKGFGVFIKRVLYKQRGEEEEKEDGEE